MQPFLTYHTPPQFFREFEEHSSDLNLRSVKVISCLLFIISSIARSLAILFPEDIIRISGYEELSLNNWLQILISMIFFFLSMYTMRNELPIKYKKVITLVFLAYFLTSAFNISYIISLHNTKNTLFIFLVGIVTVSLFFAIEYKQIKIITIYIVGIYIATTCMSNTPIEQKILNFVAGLILGISLFSFSRYSYYFKSTHFVQLKELEEKNQEILHLNTQKGEILSFVAHDLRAPLNNIEALSQILAQENSDNTEAKMIACSVTQAKNIINDLIEATKLDQSVLEKENILLAPFIGMIINNWETNTNREIVVSQENKDLMINANPSKLERVIDNLISNAFKFSPPDKPINITISERGNNIYIKIRDFGIGIPNGLQSYIFDQFSKAGRPGLNGEKSMGLGLHISHKIVEQHQGKLSVNSKENEGTTFTIQLPLEVA